MKEDVVVVVSFFPRLISVSVFKTKDFVRGNNCPHFHAARQYLIPTILKMVLVRANMRVGTCHMS